MTDEQAEIERQAAIDESLATQLRRSMERNAELQTEIERLRDICSNRDDINERFQKEVRRCDELYAENVRLRAQLLSLAEMVGAAITGPTFTEIKQRIKNGSSIS